MRLPGFLEADTAVSRFLRLVQAAVSAGHVNINDVHEQSAEARIRLALGLNYHAKQQNIKIGTLNFIHSIAVYLAAYGTEGADRDALEKISRKMYRNYQQLFGFLADTPIKEHTINSKHNELVKLFKYFLE